MTVEEKAKRYADKPTHSRYQKDRRLKFESYKDGYTQAITDLSAEKKKLREALREAYDLIVASTEYEVEIPRYREGLLKINELLKLNS